MNNIKYIISFITIIILTSCSKDCISNIAECNDQPPEGQLCQASFLRWFYNSETNSCEQIGYTGCSGKGFVTLEECNECECNK